MFIGISTPGHGAKCEPTYLDATVAKFALLHVETLAKIFIKLGKRLA
jgi:hypothetical protein